MTGHDNLDSSVLPLSPLGNEREVTMLPAAPEIYGVVDSLELYFREFALDQLHCGVTGAMHNGQALPAYGPS